MTAPDRDLPKLLEEWRSAWLDDIREDVFRALQNRIIWKGVRDGMIELGDDANGTWFQSYTWNYVDAQVMFVRRHARPQSEGAERGLGRLLNAIATNPRAISRSDWTDHQMDSHLDPHHPAVWKRRAGAAFTEYFGANESVDADVPAGWRALLETECESVSDLATRQVAHMERHRLLDRDPVSFDDLDGAVDAVARVFTWTNLLLTGSPVLLPPTIEASWPEPLRRGIPATPQHDGLSNYGPPPSREGVTG